MNAFQLALNTFFRQVLVRQEGQDIVEYSLVLACVALGCTTGMGTLAGGVTSVFSAVTTTLTTNV